MPAFDLAEQTATLSRFDVVGRHSEEVPKFVRHVALFNLDNRDVNHGDTVDVVHMGPPLETDQRLSVDVAGRIPLTNDQINAIHTWIGKVAKEYQAQNVRKLRQYIIDPPWEDIRDKNTGVYRYRRYSCAGFVLYAYRQVDVSLLVIDEEALPEVTKETMEAAYPEAFRQPNRRADFGIQGNGPWRIVLAGYVLHALDRSREDIEQEPYVAQEGDELF